MLDGSSGSLGQLLLLHLGQLLLVVLVLLLCDAPWTVQRSYEGPGIMAGHASHQKIVFMDSMHKLHRLNQKGLPQIPIGCLHSVLLRIAHL